MDTLRRKVTQIDGNKIPKRTSSGVTLGNKLTLIYVKILILESI